MRINGAWSSAVPVDARARVRSRAGPGTVRRVQPLSCPAFKRRGARWSRATTRTAPISPTQAQFSWSDTSRIIEAVILGEGRPPESVFDFVQGGTASARSEPPQEVRLDVELKAKRLMDGVA